MGSYLHIRKVENPLFTLKQQGEMDGFISITNSKGLDTILFGILKIVGYESDSFEGQVKVKVLHRDLLKVWRILQKIVNHYNLWGCAGYENPYWNEKIQKEYDKRKAYFGKLFQKIKPSWGPYGERNYEGFENEIRDFTYAYNRLTNILLRFDAFNTGKDFELASEFELCWY